MYKKEDIERGFKKWELWEKESIEKGHVRDVEKEKTYTQSLIDFMDTDEWPEFNIPND